MFTSNKLSSFYTDSSSLTDALKTIIASTTPNSPALYQAIYSVHSTALANNLQIIYPDNVPNNPNKIIELTISAQTSSPIPLPKQTDFNGWTFRVTNLANADTPLFSMQNTPTSISGISKSAIDKGDFRNIPALSNGLKMLIVHDSTAWTYRNDTPDTFFPNGNQGTPWQDCDYIDNKKRYRDDILLLQDGIAQNHPIAPYNTAATSPTCKYVEASAELSYIKNVIIDCTVSCTAPVKFVKIECVNNLLLSNITVNIPSGTTLYNGSCITIINATNLTIQDCTIENTYSNYNNYGYGIDLNTIWNVDIIRMHGTSPKWGVFGNNNINTARLRDCDINRFDIHCYGCNITCVNCLFQNDNYLAEAAQWSDANYSNESCYHIYNRYSSLYGTLIYENCFFNGFYPFLTDYAYNIHSGCFVAFKNCTMKIFQKKYAYLFKMGFWGAPINQRAEHAKRCFHNVLIDGMKFYLKPGISTVHMFFLMDRFDWNWGGITEKIYYTSSLHVRNIHFEYFGNGNTPGTPTLIEKNLIYDPNHPERSPQYENNIIRLLKGNEEYSGGEFALSNSNF